MSQQQGELATRAVDDWAERLQQALEGSSLRQPRPLVNLELPPRVKHEMGEDALAKLRPAAVLVPVIARQGVPHVILTLRSDNLRRHAGQISFPGGSEEPGDSDAIATALRESCEEIGLQPRCVSVLGFLDDYPTITGFRITPVVGILDPQATVAADDIEVASVFEVPLSYLEDGENYERKTLRKQGVDLPYFRVIYDQYSIWGATAAMLWNLREKLEAVPQ